MRLRGRLLNVSELSEAIRRSMFALMDRHYANVCPRRFAADLAQKHWVIALFDRAGELQGFSTQSTFDLPLEDRRARVLFSGDTIVDRDHWGDPALSHLWGRLALELVDAAGEAELYWFLISQGFRTYRFLPVFFHEFYPRFDRPTPADMQRTLEQIATLHLGNDYDALRGVMQAGADQYRLREALAAVPEKRRSDPHIEFFLRSNPECERGDELCCLAPLSRENFTPAAWRVINADQYGQEARRCHLPLA